MHTHLQYAWYVDYCMIDNVFEMQTLKKINCKNVSVQQRYTYNKSLADLSFCEQACPYLHQWKIVYMYVLSKKSLSQIKHVKYHTGITGSVYRSTNDVPSTCKYIFYFPILPLGIKLSHWKPHCIEQAIIRILAKDFICKTSQPFSLLDPLTAGAIYIRFLHVFIR